MRYGVLADVHGNLPALEACLAQLRELGVDRYLVAGDLVGYGPFPNECVDAVASLDPVCVAGNHDLIALGRLDGSSCIELARRSLEWTRSVLTDDSREYLNGLPLRADLLDVVLAHGSLDDPSEYTTSPEEAARQLAQLQGDHPDAWVLVLGHTHRPLAWGDAAELRTDRAGMLRLNGTKRVLVNPGAVGQSRELRVRARFAVLDLERRTVDYRAVPYDTARCREALRRNGLSPRSYHLRRAALGDVRRRLRGR